MKFIQNLFLAAENILWATMGKLHFIGCAQKLSTKYLNTYAMANIWTTSFRRVNQLVEICFSPENYAFRFIYVQEFFLPRLQELQKRNEFWGNMLNVCEQIWWIVPGEIRTMNIFLTRGKVCVPSSDIFNFIFLILIEPIKSIFFVRGKSQQIFIPQIFHSNLSIINHFQHLLFLMLF